MVDYALGHTGNVHYDAPTSDRNPEDKDWEQMQLLVKEGDDVGLIFCCPSLKRNLHLRAKKGFAVIMSECILELLGHCAAAASQSRTPVFNGRVPFTQHSLLGTFVRDVFACQAAQNIPSDVLSSATETNNAHPASPSAGNTCHPGARPSWVCANGGRTKRGTNRNPDLAGYAAWALRAPYIRITCVIEGTESVLCQAQPIGNSDCFQKKGDSNAFLKWNLPPLSNYTGGAGIQSQVAEQMRAVAKQNNQSWRAGQTTRISLLKSNG